MVRMTVLPFNGGRPVTKSKAMWDHGQLGTGRGRSRPDLDLVEDLFWVHTVQAEIKDQVSLSMVGHQNF